MNFFINSFLPITLIMVFWMILIFLIQWLRKNDKLKENIWIFIFTSVIVLALFIFAAKYPHKGTELLLMSILSISSILFVLFQEHREDRVKAAEEHQLLQQSIADYKELSTVCNYYNIAKDILKNHSSSISKKANCSSSHNMYRRKFDSLCSQVGEGRFFLGKKAFEETWKELIAASRDYYSICDLSIYANAFTGIREDLKYFNHEKKEWQRRIKDEFSWLKHNNLLSSFKKILVYDNLNIGTNNGTENEPRYACKQRGAFSCNFSQCTHPKCIVKAVALQWQEVLGDDFPNRIFMHYRVEITNALESINTSTGDESKNIKSIDIGIFDGEYLGEEYKYKVDIPNSSGLDAVGCIYRFSKNKTVASEFKNGVAELCK